MTLRFMGQAFGTIDELRKVFPAFAGQDAVRAICAGASTPLEVEAHSWRQRNKGRLRTLVTVRANAKKSGLAALQMKPKRSRRKAA